MRTAATFRTVAAGSLFFLGIIFGCGAGAPSVEPGTHAVGNISAIPMIDAKRDREFAVHLWYPASGEAGAVQPDAAIASDGPFPLVVIAHGIGGTAESVAFIGTHLASHGFFVAAPKFPGSFTDSEMNELLRDIVNHPGDVSLIIDAALGENDLFPKPLAGSVDPDRIAMMGMSFGGLATHLVTFDRELRDPRIRLAATLAGGGGDLFEPAFYDAAPQPIPLLIVHGTVDAMIEYDSVARTAFRNANKPKALLTLQGGTHLGFADGVPVVPFLHPDRIICWLFPQVDAEDPESGAAFQHLAHRVPDTGVSAEPGAPLPCTYGDEEKPWMAVKQQKETTLRALRLFLMTHFAKDAEERERSRGNLLASFGDDLEIEI